MYKVYTLRELCLAEPDTMRPFLGRQGLQTILRNVEIHVKANLETHPFNCLMDLIPEPTPDKIHTILNIQRINTMQFDINLLNLLLYQQNKRNTLVLEGPSNTDKSPKCRS